MVNRILKQIALASGLLPISVGFSDLANAASLRKGSTGSSAQVTGALPGQSLWGGYLTTEAGERCSSKTINGDFICNNGGNGDNILRLINPIGSANPFLAGGFEQTVCAMIYVFDDDEEMGECCGCPITSAGILTFSIDKDLTSNWGLQGDPEAGAHGNGAVAIVAATPNGPGSTCNPTNVPGYNVTVTNNLLGSITHNQIVTTNNPLEDLPGLTEVGLFDDGSGDPANLAYLQNQCGVLVGNGSGGGVCSCPVE